MSELFMIRTGMAVRIEGRPYIADRTTETGRIFVSKDTGDEVPISKPVQMLMMRQGRLTSEASFQALDRHAQLALERDWSAFSEIEQLQARQRYPYVKAVDDLPPPYQHKSKHVVPAIAATAALPGAAGKPPSFRVLRDLYRSWLASGRDIRVLVPAHAAKGNTTSRLDDWVVEEIERAVDEAYACDPPGSVADAQERARDLILLRSQREGLPLPVGAKSIIGQHVARRAIARRSRYELATVRFGRHHADRMAAVVGAGPQGERHLQEVEVDHSRLDVLAVDDDGTVLGSPNITILIDRYTRMIVGFSLSFVPPSWVSVMDALQMSLLPKEKTIDWICEGRERPEKDWPVWGKIENLIVDRGEEFRSVSMLGCEQALNMRVLDLPPGSPERKGKVERCFGIFNKKVFHRLPGTKFSNVAQRRKMMHEAEKQACLTLGDIRWIVLTHIVDVYNQKVHKRTGQKPIDRWNRSVESWGPSLPPDEGTIAQYVGVTPVRKLTREGVRYLGLRWNSNAMQALRDRRGDGDVVVRVDPNDLNVAWVLDDEVGEWIPGDLVSGDGAAAMTLDEFKHVNKVRKATETFDADAALSESRARERIRKLVDSKRGPPDKKKKLAAFRKEGRKPVEHIRPDRFDPEASALPMADHDMDIAPDLPTQDARGPWRETVLPPAQGVVRSSHPPSPTFEPTVEDPLPPPVSPKKSSLTIRRRR